MLSDWQISEQDCWFRDPLWENNLLTWGRSAFFYFFFIFECLISQPLQSAKVRALGLIGFNLHNKLLFHLLECLCWWMEPKRHQTFCRKTPLGTIDAVSHGRHMGISTVVVSYYTATFLFLCHYLIKSLLFCDHQTSAWRKRTSPCIYVWSQGPKEHSHKMINDELTLSKVLYFFPTASPNPKWNFIWFVPPSSYFSILSLMNKLKHLCLCFRPL